MHVWADALAATQSEHCLAASSRHFEHNLRTILFSGLDANISSPDPFQEFAGRKLFFSFSAPGVWQITFPSR